MIQALMVDDNEAFLEITKQFLEKKEPTFKLTPVSSARLALQKLAETSFDVIICDYKMPDMDGLALLREIRSINNSTPFILFTGHGREEVAMQALNQGANHYLMKGGEARSLLGN